MQECNNCSDCPIRTDEHLSSYMEELRNGISLKVDFLMCSNRTQCELIKDSGLDPLEWIQKHSEYFRKLWTSGFRDIKILKQYLYY